MKRSLLKWTVAGLGGLVASDALASGILVARFGGEHGHPTTDNPTAMYYNPAGLALGFGTRLYLDGNFAWRSFTFTRDPDAIDNIQDPGFQGGYTPAGDGVAANSGEGKLFNVLASPFVAVVTDFGIKGLGVGAGLYVPFGGQSTWDQVDAGATFGDGTPKFPGAQDGPQRWWVIEGTIRSVYITGAAAYQIPDLNLSLGLGVNVVMSEINTIRARNTNGHDHLVTGTPDGDQIQEGRTLVDVTSTDLSLGAGIIWQPTKDWWVGVSYQSQPGFGENTLKGEAEVIAGAADAEGKRLPAEITQAMPDVIRAGARWRITHQDEVRLFGAFARWSVLDEQCVLNTDIPNHSCDTGVGSLGIVPRAWEDAFEVRAGYSRWLTPEIELMGGAGFDQSAVPDTTLEPSLFDADKVSLTVGARFELLEKSLALGTSYTQVFYFAPEIEPRGKAAGGTESDIASVGIRPVARTPDSAGTYEQNIGVFNLNVQYTF